MHKKVSASLSSKSLLGSKTPTRGATELRRTESQILNDPEIWHVSDSDANSVNSSEDVLIKEEEPSEQKLENEVMRYLVEKAPSMVAKEDLKSDKLGFNEQRPLVKKREVVCQMLAELCILRCLKPEELQGAMQRFMNLVINPNYIEFRTDLLMPFLNERGIEL